MIVVYRFRALRWGLAYHHPLCCVLRFVFCRHDLQGARRGGKRTAKAGYFVPCGIVHRHDPDRPPLYGYVIFHSFSDSRDYGFERRFTRRHAALSTHQENKESQQ